MAYFSILNGGRKHQVKNKSLTGGETNHRISSNERNGVTTIRLISQRKANQVQDLRDKAYPKREKHQSRCLIQTVQYKVIGCKPFIHSRDLEES